MKPAKITAGKGLTMRLLAVSEGGDEHETSQCHGRQRVNHVVACCVGVEVEGGGGDEHEASLHHGRQRVNGVVVAVSGVVTAGKGLMMWLLCQGWSRQAKG